MLWLLFDSEGRPEVAHTCWADGRVASERYEYADNGRVFRIEHTADPHPDFPTMRDWPEVTSPVYGDSGDLIAVDAEAEWKGRKDRRRLWRTPADRAQLRAWREAAEEGLARELVRAATTARPGEPLAAVGLLYSEQRVLPPLLGVLPASERDGFVAAHGDRDVAPYLWNPAEWSSFDTPPLALTRDQELLGVMEELVLEWQMGLDHEPGRRLLNRVSKRLNDAPWPVSTTSDFVVFASDLELTDTPGNLRATLSKERLRDLRRRGWLLEDD